GVFVKVSAGDFGADPVGYESDSYLGKTDYPFIGRNQYPVVPLKIEAASAGEACVGVTLLQTAQYDENDEKLLYYPQKKLEVQAVLTGEAVPVLGKGIITVDSDSVIDGSATVGHFVKLSSNAGKITGHASESHSNIGQILATGNRVNRGVSPDQFAGNSVGTGAANTSGAYAVIRINC
ncbi:MAG: hypothetical protein CL885_05010, partial [Dehalococcoidia bacterium]|nr:hypothetical protein [Dehalococcoidia bacterium]